MLHGGIFPETAYDLGQSAYFKVPQSHTMQNSTVALSTYACVTGFRPTKKVFGNRVLRHFVISHVISHLNYAIYLLNSMSIYILPSNHVAQQSQIW